MSNDVPGRMLRLLSLLQMRREWSGADLADRLGVTVRTVRRDIDRLRELGYPVNSGPDHHGSYRLASGTDLPPLLLDDDEAVAIAVALRATASGITGIAETALLALAKLDQVLPARLRNRITELQMITPLHYFGGGPQGRARSPRHRGRSLPRPRDRHLRLHHPPRHHRPVSTLT